MNTNAIAVTMLIALAMAALQDLTGYLRARQNFQADPITNSIPTWDWGLFAARMGIGLCTGILTALGAGAVTP
jgi:hypothetical protein